MKRPSERPRARERYHHGDLPAALVETALAILAEEGEDALSVRAVARRVGVDHSAAYRHFEDKRAILAAIAERGFRELVLVVRAAITREPADDPAARVLAIATAYVEFALARPALFRLMLGPRLNEDGRFPSLESAVMEAFELLQAAIEDGIARGVFARDLVVRDAAGCVWSTSHGLAVLALGGRIRIKPERVAQAVRNVLGPVVRGLRA